MLRRLFASALAPAAAAALVLAFPGELRELAAEPGARLLLEVLEAAGWVAPLLIALLALRHGRGRIVLAALTVAATGLVSAGAIEGIRVSDPLTGLVLILATALSFLAISLCEERGLLTRVGFPRLMIFAGWSVGLGWLLRHRSRWLDWALEPLGAAVAPIGQSPWSPLALAVAGSAGASSLLARRRDRVELGPALCWALASTLAGLTAAHGRPDLLDVPLAPAAFSCAAAFVLAQGLHALAWRHGNVDELTGLPSRRALEERLPRLSGTYTVAVLDLDRFKLVNDRHGHEAGDAVLQAVADRLRRFEGGTFFRSGGEEFVAILPGLSLEEAAPLLEGLRGDIGGRSIPVPALPGRMPTEVKIHVSIGAAQRTRHDPSPERVIAAADAALLRAKRNGRNRVCLELRTEGRGRRRWRGRKARRS